MLCHFWWCIYFLNYSWINIMLHAIKARTGTNAGNFYFLLSLVYLFLGIYTKLKNRLWCTIIIECRITNNIFAVLKDYAFTIVGIEMLTEAIKLNLMKTSVFCLIFIILNFFAVLFFTQFLYFLPMQNRSVLHIYFKSQCPPT